MLLRMTDINKFYNGNQVLSHVSLTVEDHDRIGLVGVNGCGKSTLLRILTEQELPDHLVEGDGEIARSAKTSIGYLEQMGGLDRESTVWEEMRSVFRPLLETQERMHQLEEAMQSGDMAGAEEYHRLQTWFENNGGYQIDVKIRTVLNGMGFTQETYSRIISGFSGGEKNTACHCTAAAGGTESADSGRAYQPLGFQDRYVAGRLPQGLSGSTAAGIP